MNTHQRVMEMLEMSEDEKFARMVVALETIAGCMTAEMNAKRPPRVLPEIDPSGMIIVKKNCPNCGVVMHEITRQYVHCTMCGKLSAVD